MVGASRRHQYLQDRGGDQESMRKLIVRRVRGDDICTVYLYATQMPPTWGMRRQDASNRPFTSIGSTDECGGARCITGGIITGT